ncbi:19150_t:CDS:2 [Racocetra fulgida]|uniref:19150_t:CDS:1 n=1 Tax=Racocetra fulgida TaxID=60492 RepID=A0A9N8ZK37_9GLOM|nr:19150_t:CDS:2 [Racocetra fulgida]
MALTKTPDANKNELYKEVATKWHSIKKKNNKDIEAKIREYLNTPVQLYKKPIGNNAAVQKNIFEKIKSLESDLSELEQMITITTNLQCHNSLRSQIIETKKNIAEEEEQLKKLKRYAAS